MTWFDRGPSMDDYQKIEQIIAKKHGLEANESRKSMGDFKLADGHPVNVKSSNLDKANYSPNLISAMRLVLWLKVTTNRLSFVFVDYRKTDGKIRIVRDSGLVSVEHLSWDCMTIQAQAYLTYLDREARKAAKIRRMLDDL